MLEEARSLKVCQERNKSYQQHLPNSGHDNRNNVNIGETITRIKKIKRGLGLDIY